MHKYSFTREGVDTLKERDSDTVALVVSIRLLYHGLTDVTCTLLLQLVYDLCPSSFAITTTRPPPITSTLAWS